MKVLPLSTLALMISSPVFADFNCPNRVDPKKVVLFVDANDAPAEVEGAAKAACQRGETLQVLPKRGNKTYVGPAALKQEIANLASRNVAISSMIVSGHDGGGKVHGVNGSMTKHDVVEALKMAYASKPQLLKEMKSIFMWGCWSMGPSEVEFWKTELPDIKLAAGFMDMGPSKNTRAVHTVLNDLLVKEKNLVAEADKNRLKRSIQGIQDINVTLPAIYTDAACGDMYYYKTEGDLYSRPDPDNPFFTPGVHYVDFDESFDCKKMTKQIEEKRKTLIKYFYGELPLPKDGPDSPIKGIYSFLRATAKCHTKPNHIMNGDRVFLLRFYEETKENFANVFSDVISEANKEIVGLNALLDAKSKEAVELQKYIKEHHAKKYFNPRYPTLKNKGRKEILDMISYLDGLVKQPLFRNPKLAPKVAHLKKLRNAMDIYLFQLHPHCMDFMEWHEVFPGYNPRAKCQI